MNAPTGPVNLTEHRGSSGETRLRSQVEPSGADIPAQVPRHVAIIMDGNGRWAEQRGMPRLAGHREGVNAIPRVVDALAQRGVLFLTIYAFSTENWSRPVSEVEGIVQLLHETLQRETDRFNRKNVRVVHIGNADRLSPEIRDAVERIQEKTGGNTGLVLNVAFDYGGRQEILSAVKALIREGVSPEDVSEEVFGSRLFTAHSPDPDLIIRTGGELRISNFLLWQSAYSEYFHTPVLWPDLDEAELDRALASYGNRQRRFGNVTPDAGS